MAAGNQCADVSGRSLAGWWAESSGLLADGLDMFADAAVYGAALWAVGRGVGAQFGAARLAGWLQALLAAGLSCRWRGGQCMGPSRSAPR